MKNKFDLNSPILFITLSLLAIGVVMVYSASSFKAQALHHDSNYFLKSHFYKVLIGVLLMVVAANVDYKFWLRLSPLLVLVSVCVLLFLVLAPNVPQIRGSKRWLYLGFIQFQPSDLARLALIMFLSFSLGSKRMLRSEGYQRFLFHLIVIAFIVGPVILQPDVGTALLTTLIALSIVFVAGEKLHYLFSLVLFTAPLAILMLMRDGYQRIRIIKFWESVQGKDVAWQTHQSLIAFGNGHILGLGLGSGKQKYHFLPDPFTDFIYSIIGEELGLIGTILILLLFCLFIWYGFKIVRNSTDKSAKLLAFGLVFNISVYAFTNAGVVLNLLPTTGIPMPFLSYGGSALLVNMLAVGILLNLSAQVRRQRRLVPVKNATRRRLSMVR